MAKEGEKLRVDARANRDRILDVARDALATDPAASLNSIAKEGSCAYCRSGMRKNFQPMLFIQDIGHCQLVYARSLILL